MWATVRNFPFLHAPMSPSTSTMTAIDKPLSSSGTLAGKSKIPKVQQLTVRVSRFSDDTLDDAEDRFWSEFCSSPASNSYSVSNGNSQDRLLQVLQHLNKKI